MWCGEQEHLLSGGGAGRLRHNGLGFLREVRAVILLSRASIRIRVRVRVRVRARVRAKGRLGGRR